jgi:charged multivesicular body protein 2A
MSFLFGGRPPTTAEMASRFKIKINRSVREIDRESARLAAEERQLMAELKKEAPRDGKLAMQKAHAVVRSRRMANKFSHMKAHLQGIATRIQSIKTTEALQRAVGSAVHMMKCFNQTVGGKHLIQSLADMERHTATINIQGELIDEQLDAAFDDDADEFEINDVVLQVLNEAGVDLPQVAKTGFAQPSDEELSLETRLERMRSLNT